MNDILIGIHQILELMLASVGYLIPANNFVIRNILQLDSTFIPLQTRFICLEACVIDDSLYVTGGCTNNVEELKNGGSTKT